MILDHGHVCDDDCSADYDKDKEVVSMMRDRMMTCIVSILYGIPLLYLFII